MQKENMTQLNKQNAYGLKVSTPYDLVQMPKKILHNVFGDVVLTESGVYELNCTSDTYVSHNIINGLMHITCISDADDIKINIKANGKIQNTNDNSEKKEVVSDIYHNIIANNKNVISKIEARAAAYDNSKIIYRSSFGVSVGAGGAGTQKAHFLILSNTAEIDAEPSLDIASNIFPTSHAIGVSGVDKNKIWYLATHGYDIINSEQEIVGGFLNN